MKKTKMIKLAVATRDEKYLERLANRLHGKKDINLISTIIIKNLESEVKQTLAFLKQMIEQRPDILLLDQEILRDAAAMDLQQTLNYLDKLIATKILVVGERYNEENVMVMIEGGVQGGSEPRWVTSNLLNAFAWSPEERYGSTLS